MHEYVMLFRETPAICRVVIDPANPIYHRDVLMLAAADALLDCGWTVREINLVGGPQSPLHAVQWPLDPPPTHAIAAHDTGLPESSLIQVWP